LAAWALVGALLGFSVLGAASIGLFVLPAALLALAVTVWTVRVWPEIAGMLVGAGALSLFVGLVNLGSTPCPSSGSGSVRVGGGTGITSFSCGGLDPSPWLLAALGLSAAGFAFYALARERP